MPWCSTVRDWKDGDTLGPFSKGLWLQAHIVSLHSMPTEQHPCFHPQLPQTSFTMVHQWWSCWRHPRSFGCWRWWLSCPSPSTLLWWSLPAGSCKERCPDNRMLRGAASEPLPASWCLEVHPEGSWGFVQSTYDDLFSWELTCVKEEQMCFVPVLISWWLSKLQTTLGVQPYNGWAQA